MKVFTAIFFLLISTLLYSQDVSSTRIWANGGVGYTTLDLGVNLNANMAIDNLLFTVKYAEADKLLGDSYTEFGVLAGYLFLKNKSKLSIAGGVAAGNYTKYLGLFNGSEKISYTGLITEIQYSIPIWDFLGIGVTAHANFNKEKNVLGANINLFLGNLWE